MLKKVFLSGSFDPLHSGHVALFAKAAEYGRLYVGIGSDDSIRMCKHRVFMPQEERLYMVKAIKYVEDASVNSGMARYDYLRNPMFLQCDILIVNKETDSEIMRLFCDDRKIEYMVWDRIHPEGLPHRSSTEIRGY